MSAKDEPLNRSGMTTKQRDEWNNRAVTTTVTEHCFECKTLQPDVKKQFNAYPRLEATCCGACWTKMLREAQAGHDYYMDFMC